MTTTAQQTQTAIPHWGELIDDVTAGTWINPDTGHRATVPFARIVIAPSLRGAESELVRGVMPARIYAVVSDGNTHRVQGRAVEKALGASAFGVVLSAPHADEDQVAVLREKLRGADAVIAVGSGTLNDMCKYVTAQDGRPYCVFATAPSMNGYTSTTASITLRSGLKTTQKAHGARGVFVDLEINAAAPAYLIASGFGDAICRSTAQVDWYFSHRMLGSAYQHAPFALQMDDEAALMSRSIGVGHRDIDAIGYLQRLLTLGGLGITIAGMSHPGSMGEHTISHWIDSFAGAGHPGTLHGQQVGVASVTMARLQEELLSWRDPPTVRPTLVDETGIRQRYPAAAVDMCLKACRSKAMDAAACKVFNDKLAKVWPQLRQELLKMAVPAKQLAAHLRAAGGAASAADLGVAAEVFRAAVLHGREIRDRYSFLDLAADMGILESFVEREC